MIQERELFPLKAQQECILPTIHQLKRGNDMRMKDKLTQIDTDTWTDRHNTYKHTHTQTCRQTDRHLSGHSASIEEGSLELSSISL